MNGTVAAMYKVDSGELLCILVTHTAIVSGFCKPPLYTKQ